MTSHPIQEGAEVQPQFRFFSSKTNIQLLTAMRPLGSKILITVGSKPVIYQSFSTED